MIKPEQLDQVYTAAELHHLTFLSCATELQPLFKNNN